MEKTGAHAVVIWGPSGEATEDSMKPMRQLPWMVVIDGVCPLGQQEIENRDCGCEPGFEKLACMRCEFGKIKPEPGNEMLCRKCGLEVQFPGKTRFDTLRTERRGEREVRGLWLHHGALSVARRRQAGRHRHANNLPASPQSACALRGCPHWPVRVP